MARPKIQTLARGLIEDLASRTAPLVTKGGAEAAATAEEVATLVRWYDGAGFHELLTALTSPAAARAALKQHEEVRAAFADALHRLDASELFRLHAAIRDAQLQYNPEGFGWDTEPHPWTEDLRGIGPDGVPVSNRAIAEWRERFVAEHAAGFEGG